MIEIEQGFTLYAGCDLRLEVLVRDDSGDDANLAGASAIWALIDSGRVILLKTTDAGIAISGSTLTVSASIAETSQLLPGLYQHECSVTVDGIKFPVMTGAVSVRPWRA